MTSNMLQLVMACYCDFFKNVWVFWHFLYDTGVGW